jgi:hypothetical protein
MGGSIAWKYWLWWALYSSPAVPLAFAWHRLRADVRTRMRVDGLALLVATLSVLWLDAVVANWRFLGPLFGRTHYAIIGGNLLAAFLCMLISFFASISPVARARRLATGLACLMLSVEWAMIGIVNR